MAENNPHQTETQQQRWIKYGSNVALSIVVVILLAVAVTWIAQTSGWRKDTTLGHVNSLKPQTLNILKNDHQKTKLVALYQRTIIQDDKEIPSPYRQPVVDLLDAYQRASNNIEVETIDPVKSPSKVDELIDEVTSKYGGEVKKYKDLIDASHKTYDQIKNLTSQELSKIQALNLDQAQQDQAPESVSLALVTVRELPKFLSRSRDSINERLKQKPPDYKGAVDSIQQNMENFSQLAAKIIEDFGKSKSDVKVPANIRKYMADSQPAYEQIKKLADDLIKQAKSLGELKLDQLRQSLRAKDAILVMGAKDMRVLPFEQVWKVDDRDLHQITSAEQIKPRFAGEQQISTALLALSQDKKPKVAFIRFGGPPLTTPGFPPFQSGGLMSDVAQRLRDYNYDVLEKDLSGTWAMQAQMSGRPAAPEATDAQLKDAVWVVLMMPLAQQSPMQGPPNFKAVADHLAQGGSALLMFGPQNDNFASTLKKWGIEVNTNAVASHAPIPPSGGKQGDFDQEALRYPFVFNIENYGDDMITKPLQSLQSWLVPLEVVKTSKVADVTTTPILPVPNNPKSWGETDLQALQDAKAEFQPDKGDIPGPLYGGAVAQNNKTGGRLVVIASPMFAWDQWVTAPDPAMLRRGMVVAHYPGNAELFDNSVFWLSRLDTLIAISPSAMEVSRIAPMTVATLQAWRIGALLIGLPALVLLAGGFMYFARRD